MAAFFKILARNAEYLLSGKGIGLFDKIKLKLTARHKPLTITFFGRKLQIHDSSSFVAMYEEIYIKQIYAFKPATTSPLILDCGANIGLSVLFFQLNYPSARIIAFEPDESTHSILKGNVLSIGNADIRKEAVWIANEELTFISEGGLSGHLGEETAGKTVTKVKGTRLRDLLNQPVDFLKMDIEGAEYEVIKDCADLLTNVKLLFVEYHSHATEPQRLHELLAIFAAAGFRYHIQEAYTSPAPFRKIDTMLGMDLQLNVFCYR